MAIELRIGDICSKLVPKLKGERLPLPSDILGHEKLFAYYGISPACLNTIPTDRTTTLETIDGKLCIDWVKKVIIAPLDYYSSK